MNLEEKIARVKKLFAERDAIDAEIVQIFTDNAADRSAKPEPETPTAYRAPKRIGPKLTEEVVREMQRRIDKGEKLYSVCADYDVSSPTFYSLRKKYDISPSPKDEDEGDDWDDDDDDEDDDADSDEDGDADNLRPDRSVKVVAPATSHEPTRYECACGFRFRSTIAPHLVRCPECRGRPEEVK